MRAVSILPFLIVIFPPWVISLLRAAKTKFHGLSGLHNPFAHSSGGWQFQVRALAWLVSLPDSGSLLFPHVAFPL